MHCCSSMVRQLESGETTMLYIPKFREYGVRVLDGGTSFIRILFCPWCGQSLPPSVRDQWFEKLEELKLDPTEGKIPEEFMTDAWWSTPQ
jgi:hypothetical protein